MRNKRVNIDLYAETIGTMTWTDLSPPKHPRRLGMQFSNLLVQFYADFYFREFFYWSILAAASAKPLLLYFKLGLTPDT